MKAKNRKLKVEQKLKVQYHHAISGTSLKRGLSKNVQRQRSKIKVDPPRAGVKDLLFQKLIAAEIHQQIYFESLHKFELKTHQVQFFF